MAEKKKEVQIVLESVERQGVQDGVEALFLQTNVGTIATRYHPAGGAEAAVVWVGGAGGGLDGPASGLYPRLAEQLVAGQIASLRLHYRRPNDLENCVIDTILGVQFLVHVHHHRRIALVGHSFDGAVVTSAGALSEDVTAVVAMSSQTYGTTLTPDLSPRPLLLLHGTNDEILAHACSEQIYDRANEPKEIVLYEGGRHGLDECRDEVDRDLVNWLVGKLQPPVGSEPIYQLLIRRRFFGQCSGSYRKQAQ